MNTDYKILTKALANRLQKVLPKLINPDQVGYIKGRYIGENIRIINDIQNSAAISKFPGYIVLVDFQKAFDTIEWSFLIECLKSYNFGSNFIKWIKIFYNNIQSCVGNNGFYSGYFNLTGIKQGCPISALLFIMSTPLGGGHIIFPFSAVRRPTWFPDILSNSSYPIFTKVGMQVYWVNSLYGIAFAFLCKTQLCFYLLNCAK